MTRKEGALARQDEREKKVMRVWTAWLVIAVAVCLLASTSLSAQEDDAAALAKAAQNPIADMISLPFQNNTNFDVGPLEKTQDILNIQPVLPFGLNTDWNLITRTIVPLISQPAFAPDQDREFGLGDVQFSTFFSPKKVVDGWVWGAGAIAQLDTATNDRLGQGAWGLGPTAVALHLGKTWVYGALINNVWSVSTEEGRSSVNQMLLQPFINYNFPTRRGAISRSLRSSRRIGKRPAANAGPCRSGWASGRSCGSGSSQ